MGKTIQHLMEAFAGESQANRKYLAFAKQADKEGFPQAARLFRAAAEAETVHALAHLKAMGGVGDTRSNLREALAGETHEFTAMYPGMIADASAEGEAPAERSFRMANQVEQQHAGLYEKMLAGLDAAGESYPYHVCPVCGFTAEHEAPERCPICGTKGELFTVVE